MAWGASLGSWLSVDLWVSKHCYSPQYTAFWFELYTVKKVIDFPVPRRGVTDQTLPGRE
jgi:hypothetical protein